MELLPDANLAIQGLKLKRKITIKENLFLYVWLGLMLNEKNKL